MIKKLIILFNIIFVISNLGNITFSDEIIEEDIQEQDILNIVETSATSEEIKINSRIAVVYDRATGNVIWGKDENKRTAMASTTKIMTAIVTVENANLDDIVTVSEKAAGTGGSRLGLKKDDKISLRDLLYGLMLRSGNDSAIAIAEHVSGSVEEFANLMNEKSQELKLKDTHFVTPHGLDDPEHYTTAYELARIADYALNNETIKKIVSSKYYTITINGYPKDLINTNELLGNLDGVYGVKTGFTNNAGRCLVTAVNRNDMDIITVVLQADTKKDRTKDSSEIIKYIYENYEKVNIKKIIDEEYEKWCQVNKGRLNIEKSRNKGINLKKTNLKDDVIIIKKCDSNNIKVTTSAVFNYAAPIKKGTIIGKMKVTIGDKIVDILDIYIENDIEKKEMWDYFIECLKAYKNIS